MGTFFLVLAGVMVLVGAYAIGILSEKRAYNNGFCPFCGNLLRHFDTDSQGGRGYCCDDCGYHTWVSYNMVDKKR